MGEMGGGWWDSFRREMLKRRWIGDQSLEDSDSSDSSEVPEVPEVNSRLPFYYAFAYSRNKQVSRTSKCPAEFSPEY